MTYRCKVCNKQIPQARVDFLLETKRSVTTCVEHSSEEAVVGFMVYPHKTGSQCVVVRPENEEALRRAERADKRAR